MISNDHKYKILKKACKKIEKFDIYKSEYIEKTYRKNYSLLQIQNFVLFPENILKKVVYIKT